MSVYAVLEQLTAYATGPEATDEILKAKTDFFAETGEVREDERQYEARMAAFLDHYLVARASGSPPRTPAERFLAERGAALPPEERAAALGLTRTLQGLYEVLAVGQGEVTVLDLLHDERLRVIERRNLAGLNAGDLVETRLIPIEAGAYAFSNAFIYHPREARPAIQREIKRRRARGQKLGRPFVCELARMSLKVDRYKKIPIAAIYSFERPSFPAHGPPEIERDT